MESPKEAYKAHLARALTAIAREADPAAAEILPDALVAENPPKPELGDVGYPMFGFAKLLRKAPQAIAQAAAARLAADPEAMRVGSPAAEGPYLNLRVSRAGFMAGVLEAVERAGEGYGAVASLAGKKIMLEFSSPNANKPLHLGHLRNDALGESVARILAACGAEVLKINLVNDRGIHICKSMLAYMRSGAGGSPESAGMKGDKYVGMWYVEYARLAKEDPSVEEAARELLRKWEANDPETRALWKKMNEWVFSGIQATYARTDVSFDKYYRESETFVRGREEILQGLAKGVFYKAEDGAVMVDCESIGLDKKVLLRSDGTSIYITQDVGTALQRHDDWPFDWLVYVVASEQQYHFKVLFHILGLLGYEWARDLHHLSYGMVNLPEGRMKSREGTVVDADDLIDELAALAKEEIAAKGREEEVGDPAAIAERIALGALHYYLLQATPTKDMVFNPKESLSFNGDTGPYLQYMGARICSMLRKFDADPAHPARKGKVDPTLLSSDTEWELAKQLSLYPGVVEEAGKELSPAVVAAYLYELAKAFSRFYRDNQVLGADNPDLAATRLALSRAVLLVLRKGLNLILIPFLETM